MTADEILSVAEELNCEATSSAVTFARIIAERCALLADECREYHRNAGEAIREAFNLHRD